MQRLSCRGDEHMLLTLLCGPLSPSHLTDLFVVPDPEGLKFHSRVTLKILGISSFCEVFLTGCVLPYTVPANSPLPSVPLPLLSFFPAVLGEYCLTGMGLLSGCYVHQAHYHVILCHLSH